MWPFKGKDFVTIERINGRKVNQKLRVGETVKLDLPDGRHVELELSEDFVTKRRNRWND